MLSRIQIILKSKKLSPSKFAEEIGVKRSAMSHILSGRNNPSLEFIQKVLSQYPEIRADWLLFGKGQMFKDLQLFNTDAITPQELNKNESNNLQYDIEDSEDLNDEPENLTFNSKQNSSPPTHSIKSSDKAIDKIVIFYTDKSFAEYKPEESEER